jgi:uncharacterized membrane protein YebE (DUF533 family)
MSGRSVATTALTVAGVSIAAGAVAYAVYFDYKRRNDVEFRRQLRQFLYFRHASERATDPTLSTRRQGEEEGGENKSADPVRDCVPCCIAEHQCQPG